MSPKSAIFALVGVTRTSGREELLNGHDDEDGNHGDKTRHGRVALVPETRETWIRERDEGRREEMHEGSSDENTCSEMTGQK